jgi:hypothetical protein
MAIEVWEAEKLADLLIGLEDTRADLKRYYIARQEGDPTKYVNEIVEAAERWDDLQEQLCYWPEDMPDREAAEAASRVVPSDS